MGQTISSCPNSPKLVSYDDGSLYEICPNTAYIGSSYKTLTGVLSTYDCLFYCNQDPVCTRSSYRASDETCLFSKPTSSWWNSTDWDSVRLVNKTVQQQQANVGLGQWSTVTVVPVIPVGAYIVPEYPSATRVMMYSSWNDNDFTTDSEAGTTQFAEYNILTGNSSHRTVANTHHDMFCPGMSSLQDGRLMITGGNNANVTSFWDPVTGNFTLGPVMNIPRGYHSSTITSKGQVFTIGGSYSGGLGGKNGELYDPATNKWSLLPNVSVTPILTNDAGGIFRSDNHAWLYGWKNGSVFQGGPSIAQHWIYTSGNGDIENAGSTRGTSDAMCAIHVMYDAVAGKILSAGGSPSYSYSDALNTAFVTTIGNPGDVPQVVPTGSLNHARGFANAVVLPDGTVLVTGGQNRSLIFTDIAAWYTAELWNPATGVFTELAPAAIPRNYHSMSILLPDGRVMVGGGGLCDTPQNMPDTSCPRTDDHPDIEIFSPPYLFNQDHTPASRPAFLSVSSSSDSTGRTVIVGGTLSVTLTSSGSATFSLIRIGSVTHSTNTDQRRVPLSNVQQQGSKFTIGLPKDAGITVPGFYYLFALNQAGVPSVAQTIRIVLQ